MTLSLEPEKLGHIQAIRNGIACLKLLCGVLGADGAFPKGAGARVEALTPLSRAGHSHGVAVGGRCSTGSMRGKCNPAKEQSTKSKLCWECLMLN